MESQDIFPYSKATKERRLRYVKRLIAGMKEVMVELEREVQFLEQDKPVKTRQARENKYTAMLRRK